MAELRRIAVLICICSAPFWAQSPTQSSTTGQATQSTQSQSDNSDFSEVRKLLRQGKYEDAIAQLQDLKTRNPNLRGVSHELGAANYTKGDYIKATDFLRQALDEDPNDNEAVQLLGLSYYLSGRPADAIPNLEKVQSWYPRANVNAAYILGMCYMQTHDYEKARKAFARMYDVPQDSAASYLFTARMLLRQEFEPVAEEYAQKAVALDPKLPHAHFLLGELHMFKSRIPEAIAEFNEELIINPGDAATYYKLGDAYSRVQKYEEAEQVLQRSIWLDATSTGPYILMGKVLAKKGEGQLAVRALQHALSMDPNNSVAHHLLGQTYRDLGRAEDAEKELKLAEQLINRETEKP
jgi:tetratricopeptide (TPR) repeat protein